jgi:hypothetical protein
MKYEVEVPFILWATRTVEAEDEDFAVTEAMDHMGIGEDLNGDLHPMSKGTRLSVGEGSAEYLTVGGIGVTVKED